VAGQCATGLRCLRQCDCKTVKGNSCIFPFSYKGETYNSCTKAESSNGVAWCATEVDDNGEVVNNKWEDCDSLCPGSDFTCNDGFLFNVEGKCVNGTEAPGLLRSLQEGPLAATLDDIPSESSQKQAPLCNDIAPRIVTSSKKSSSNITCGCTKEATVMGLDGNPRGGCTPPRDEVGIEDLEYGWCFLENIVDPANPQNGCHEDVQWSEVDGRFWSNIACFEENQEPHECLSTLNNPCIFPFSYNEVTHEKCTHVGSENGAAWCATEIDSEGKVVTNKWEDCQASCPVE